MWLEYREEEKEARAEAEKIHRGHGSKNRTVQADMKVENWQKHYQSGIVNDHCVVWRMTLEDILRYEECLSIGCIEIKVLQHSSSG